MGAVIAMVPSVCIQNKVSLAVNVNVMGKEKGQLQEAIKHRHMIPKRNLSGTFVLEVRKCLSAAK